MYTTVIRTLMLATILGAVAAPPAYAAPAPKRTAHPVVIPTPTLPNKKLHTEFVVEVNARGQVVRVKSGKHSVWPSFNAQTYGNVLQMWIRHPDGSAQVGLYRVTYDYNPKTKKVYRGFNLLKSGGNWGNQQGAALQMMDVANKEARGAKLPPLDKIIGTPTPRP